MNPKMTLKIERQVKINFRFSVLKLIFTYFKEEIIDRLSSMQQQLLDDRKMIDYMQLNNTKLKSFMDAQDESFYTM
jgi:hypothetical protein